MSTESKANAFFAAVAALGLSLWYFAIRALADFSGQ